MIIIDGVCQEFVSLRGACQWTDDVVISYIRVGRVLRLPRFARNDENALPARLARVGQAKPKSDWLIEGNFSNPLFWKKRSIFECGTNAIELAK